MTISAMMRKALSGSYLKRAVRRNRANIKLTANVTTLTSSLSGTEIVAGSMALFFQFLDFLQAQPNGSNC
jgi:hypothetical protein